MTERPTAGSAPLDPDTAENLERLRPLLIALQDLKRLKPAHAEFSLGGDAFLRAWAALRSGSDPHDVALSITRTALIDSQLGGLEEDVFLRAGLDAEAAADAQARALDAAMGGAVNEAMARDLRAAGPLLPGEDAPRFAYALAAQPRAGATHPTEGRLYLDPPESHAEHCFGVAVYGILCAPLFGAAVEPVLLAALSHHLHNAEMPDAGFAGEMLLEPWLGALMAGLRDAALGNVPRRLGDEIHEALSITTETDSPEAKAFHAADVLDRVLDVVWRAEAAAFSVTVATDTYGLVHDGPVKPFHEAVLSAAGLPS